LFESSLTFLNLKLIKKGKVSSCPPDNLKQS
jgi:hypothetical protein